MLKKLHIQNFALIDNLSAAFHTGLNVLTGETGAGKSIIIDAVNLILGARSRSDLIRQGTDVAVIEALFIMPDLLQIKLNEADIVLYKDGILIRREVHKSGRNRCFINDSPVSLSFLSEVGDQLVDLHGQHDHQTLLKVDKHLQYLDAYHVDDLLLQNVNNCYREYRSLEKELNDLCNQEKILKEKQELLGFQIREIDQTNPVQGEEEALIHEERLLKSSEQLFQMSASIAKSLDDGEHPAIEKLVEVESILERFQNIDPKIAVWFSDCQSARIQMEELVSAVKGFVSDLEFDPERLEQIRERLGQFSHLKKKYGPTMAAVLDFWEDGRKELNTIENFDTHIQELENQFSEKKTELTSLCSDLSENRKQAASLLESKMTEILAELGLPKAVFKVDFGVKESAVGIEYHNKTIAVTNRGIDQIEFQISLNPGEFPKPLARIASGGEISRLMLALKTIFAKTDQIPVLIFDEIDTGISGRIARVVGKNLYALSKDHQLICITHLPQIASLGETHFAVEKNESDGRVTTQIRLLNQSDRTHEIAKLLGGEIISESVLESARELLKSGIV